jgi:hypothetical protein
VLTLLVQLPWVDGLIAAPPSVVAIILSVVYVLSSVIIPNVFRWSFIVPLFVPGIKARWSAPDVPSLQQ